MLNGPQHTVGDYSRGEDPFILSECWLPVARSGPRGLDDRQATQDKTNQMRGASSL